MEDQLLKIKGLYKSFPGVRALAGVDFDLRAGEVHALMGENGAGKSTLIKTLTGVHQRDAGDIWLGGQPIAPNSPRQAEALGIKTVYQEVNLIPHLSIAENIMLGRQPRRFGIINWSGVRRKAQQALDRLGLSLDLNRELGSCSAAIAQMVAIARAVSEDAKILILDEPTSSLDEKEVDDLFTVIQGLRDSGLGVVFVTHFLDQVYRISDRITVLRDGQRVGQYLTGELPPLQLIGAMLGKPIDEVESLTASKQPSEPSASQRVNSQSSDCLLQANQFGRSGSVAPLDIQVNAGEVVGLAGLLGSGRSEVARLLFGLDAATSGTLSVNGQTHSRWSPRAAIRAGLAYCPEDRKVAGIVAELSVRENILLAIQANRSILKTVPIAQQKELADHYIQRLQIKTPTCEAPAGTLSGGNQQKVLLARWLAMSPQLLILDEPTRGIDVGARAEIESLIQTLRQQGMAIVLIASEIDELVRVCQSVVVMRDRKKIGQLTSPLTQKQIMQMIAGNDG